MRNSDQYDHHDQKLPFEERTARDPQRSFADYSSKTPSSRQNTPSRSAERPYRKPENRYIEEDIFDGISGAFSRGVEGVKATFNRMLDHSKAFLAGAGAQIAAFFIPSTIDITPGFTFLTTYLGLIMLFPSRPNRFALGVGVIAAIIMVISGLWPLAAIIGGLIAAITGTRDAHIGNKIFWATIPLALLMIVGSVAQHPETILGLIPLPTIIALILTQAFGLFAPQRIRRKFSYYFMSEAEKKAYRETEKEIEAELKILAEMQQLKAEKAQKYALFGRHIEVLKTIETQVIHLPNDIADTVVEIGISSVKIIKSMERDPRDVLTGGRFLNRYLPLIQENLTKYIHVSEYASGAKLQELHDDIAGSMKTLQSAFDKLSDELIENDLHDLKIDTNVIDKLLTSQGFEIKR